MKYEEIMYLAKLEAEAKREATRVEKIVQWSCLASIVVLILLLGAGL